MYQKLELESLLLTRYFNQAVWVYVIFYSSAYALIGALAASLVLAAGAVFIAPATVWLLNQKYNLSARLLFLVASNVYIFATSILFLENIGAQYYYIPAVILATLIFDHHLFKFRILGIAIPITFWVLYESFRHTWLPPNWPSRLPFDANWLRRVNFLGALGLSLYFIRVFTKQIKSLSNSIVQQSHEHSERLQFVLDGANLGSWDWDLLTNKVKFDKKWCEMLGLHPEEVPHEILTWESRVHPSDKNQAYQDIQKHLNGENLFYENTHRMRHANGKWVWILDRGKISERDAQGNAVRFSGTHLDITRLKEAEFQLEEAQRIAKLGSWSFDVSTGKIKWSKELFKLFPEDPNKGEPTYERHLSTIHEEDRPLWVASVEACIQHGTPYHFRFRSVFPDSIKWLEAYGQAEKGADGKTIALHGTCQDITDRVLKEEENKMIIDFLNIGVWKFNVATQELHWDNSMYRLFEINPADFSGHYDAWESSLTPTSKAKAVEELQLALEGKKEFDTYFTIKLKDGSERHVGGRGRVIRNQKNEPILMYGINWDRTQEINLSKQLETERGKSLHTAKLASLGEMAAGVAHEINNPMTVIAGSVAVLQKFVNNPEKILEKTETIKKNIERVTKIVNGLRKFSRNNLKKQMLPCNINEIIQEALVLAELRAKKAEVEIQTELLSKNLIIGDELDLEQVLVNLINNAIDAAKNSEKKTVSIQTFEQSKSLVVKICDSGPGIPESNVNKIFEPFFTTKTVGQGTGLGLSIVKGILDDHDATIELTSNGQSKHPTCFEIRFTLLPEGRSPTA